MDRMMRALMVCLLLVSGAACTRSRGGEAGAMDLAAAEPARRGSACPPGTISDGVRCRAQRGIIIDQKKPAPEPRPAPPEPLPPAPLPAPAPLPPN